MSEAEALRDPSKGQAFAALERAAAALSALGEILAAENDRWALWLPVLLGLGVGLYFALLVEPSPWVAPAIMVIALLAAIAARRHIGALMLSIALATLGAGLGMAQLRAYWVAAPVLEKRWGPAELTGRVVAVEIRADDRRITLDRLVMPGLPEARVPANVRIRTREPLAVHPGERMAVRAVLMPPPAPAAPGAYDFQRQAWFDRLGAVGYSVGPLRVLADVEKSGLQLWLNAARQDVVERTLAAIPGPAGAVAAALLTGEQGTVPPDVMGWMRDSGLAHLLSVSGLHLALVATIVFAAVRRSLALIGFVALRFPIKKWAAVAAFLAISAYTMFVAPGVPTLRSWLMTSVVLLAIVIDRTAISMRLVAWAAAAVLLIAPESMLGPSFQMSFAAVVALIAAWEVAREPLARWRAGAGVLKRGAVVVLGLGMTSLVAGFASAPYALYHFNRFAAYGLAANLLAVPLTSIWVMPWAVVAYLLFPFGLEYLALIPMGWGAEGIVLIARAVAGWGGAVALLPEMPSWGLVVITLGGLWLCLWRTRWRLLGVPVILIGLAAIPLHRGPDVLVSGDARLLAVRGADGMLRLSSDRLSKLTRETWLRRAGQEENAETWPQFGASADGGLTCDASSCLYRARGHVVALVRDAAALVEDCRHADVVIALVPVRRPCLSAAAIIDRFALWREGSHAVWLSPEGRVRIESIRGVRGDRPWVPPLPTPRPRPGEERVSHRSK